MLLVQPIPVCSGHTSPKSSESNCLACSAFKAPHHPSPKSHPLACTQEALNKYWSNVKKFVSLFPFTAIEGKRLWTAITSGFSSPMLRQQNYPHTDRSPWPAERRSAVGHSQHVWLKQRGARPPTGAGGSSALRPWQSERGLLKTRDQAPAWWAEGRERNFSVGPSTGQFLGPLSTWGYSAFWALPWGRHPSFYTCRQLQLRKHPTQLPHLAAEMLVQRGKAICPRSHSTFVSLNTSWKTPIQCCLQETGNLGV